MPTQRDIASRLGVSQSTVAFAFSETHSGKISQKSRALILRTAREMGYVPNRAGRRLARVRSATAGSGLDQVGMVYFSATSDHDSSAFSDRVFLDILRGCEREFSSRDVAMTFSCIYQDEGWSKLERLLNSGGIDGLTAYGAITDDHRRWLAGSGLPWVVLGDHTCTEPTPCVNFDFPRAMELAAEHLASLGHRRIVYLGSGNHWEYQKQMLAGFEVARWRLGLDTDPELIVNHGSWPERGRGETMPERLDRMPSRPTAIIAAEPTMASGVKQQLEAAGWRVPTDISLLAAELGHSQSGDSAFTEITFDMATLGKKGAALLTELAAATGTAGTATPRQLVEAGLLSRDSTAPPPVR